jgi:hypothetical protein
MDASDREGLEEAKTLEERNESKILEREILGA